MSINSCDLRNLTVQKRRLDQELKCEFQVQAALRLALLAGSNLILHPIADKISMTVPILGFLPFESAL